MRGHTIVLLLWYTIFHHTASAEWTDRREEIVHPEGKYVVGWTIDFNSSTIIFDVVAETTGYVGFGISSQGGMQGADIVIGGIHTNGTFYFSDRHSEGPGMPIVDESQDWIFRMGQENATHTSLRFSRLLDTCDIHDMALNNDSSYIIWSMGTTDEIVYHGTTNRGSYAVNLLDPAFPDVDLSKFFKWEVVPNMTMLSDHTTYWCTVHKMPSLSRKHHVVGFAAKLENPPALRHTHHFTIYKCIAPPGVDPEEFFEPYVNHPGADCYASQEMPTRYCQHFLYVWAKGGRSFLLPEHVGYPIGETGGSEYYMLEVHYDNPDQLEGVHFETGLTVYYSDELRQNDAGILLTSYMANFALTIPPSTSNFTIAAHCSAECTSSFPPEGVRLFNVLMHAHLSGRKAKLRHFRGDKELPWIATDEHYNFDYQQNRPLRDEILLLPGDHLSHECNFDTNWKGGQVVIGGLSTRDEMCESFAWYYPRAPLAMCLSSYPSDQLFEKFGILDVNMPSGAGFEPIILAPPQMFNMTYSEALNSVFEWTDSIKEVLKRDIRFGTHDLICYADGLDYPVLSTTYPTVDKEYEPIRDCPL